ncbi:MAG TPA: isopentenyl-diphosphate Delta-isomerase [Mycobacteriales bacterium]|nr:isopentenyl-diphosphate Delta-isomerase [Mycobacteriales bacterium]
MTELVVLLDESGSPCGTAPKVDVHGPKTPYHLAFSCYAFDDRGRLLVTRRAVTKTTWPGVWTNTCCGHPRPGEEVAEAVHRRLKEELGLQALDLELALPEFSYRATYQGVEEYELCPVFLSRASIEPRPDASEVADYEWMTFDAFAGRPDISPWAQLQVGLLRPLVEPYCSRTAFRR